MNLRRVLAGIVTFTLGSAAWAELPEGIVLDHGFTFFEVDSKVDHKDGTPIDLGFTLKPGIRFVGETPDHSAVKVVVKRDGDVVAEKRTEGSRSFGPLGRKIYPVNPTPLASMKIVPGSVQSETPVIQGTGEFEVDVSYVDGATGKEHFAHTYTIEVGRVQRVRGPATLPQADTPHYYVSRHQEALTTILTGTNNYIGSYGQGSGWEKVPEHGGRYQLFWNVSPEEYSWGGPSLEAYLRCTVDGKPLTWGNPEYSQFEQLNAAGSLDEISTNTERKLQVVHSDRNSLDYRRGNPYKEYLTWHLMRTILPLNGVRHAQDTALASNTGKWECQFVDNGEVLRVFRWEVDGNGKLVPHGEQAEGLTLGPDTILVETEIPAKGSSMDGRLVPDAVQAGGFYGWKWQTRSMRKLADSVPAVGRPVPVASAPEFVPAPDKGPSPQELAKAQREADAAAAREEREASNAARDAQRKQEAADAAAAAQLQEEENERVRQKAYEEAHAKTMAEVEQTMQRAQEGMQAAQNEAESGGLHGLLRLLLGAVLLVVGVVLNGEALKRMVAPLAGVVDALQSNGTIIGFVTIGVAVVDLLLDLGALRPIIGDGLAQLAALAGGALASRSALGGLGEKVASLEGQAPLVGWACLALGVVHLIMGGAPLV